MTRPESLAVTPVVLQARENSLPSADPHIVRVRRLAAKLFNVSNCVVRLGALSGVENARTLEALETEFVYSLPLSEHPQAVLNTIDDPSMRRYACVESAPFIRFYAAHPVRDADGRVVGSIALIDYAPRLGFSEDDSASLADCASLIERELRLRSVSAIQAELQKKNKNLRRKSLIDPMISTWNRGAIMRILSIESIRCEKAGVPLALIVADLDHFKKINDTYGHPAGDAVLVRVASRLRVCIRPQDALGRYGGEEFLVVLPGATKDVAMAVAERMRAAVSAQPEVIGEVALKLTISAGVASNETFPNASTEELISQADVALYRAKDSGRNRVVQADNDLT